MFMLYLGTIWRLAQSILLNIGAYLWKLLLVDDLILRGGWNEAEALAGLSPYQYTPLPGSRSIRLLHLLPGKLGSLVHVKLRTANLDDSPSFESLSYEWNLPTARFSNLLRRLRLFTSGPDDPPSYEDLLYERSSMFGADQGVVLSGSLDYGYSWIEPVLQEENSPVFCDGGYLLVMRNLHDFLTRVRDPHRSRCLWADAICINQADLEKRSKQVPLMADIYQQAQKVLLWIEADSFMTDTAFELIKELARSYERAAQSSESHPTGGRPEIILICPNVVKLLKAHWSSIADL